MNENEPKLLKDHVITHCRNGRRYYDPEVKRALVHHAAMPGASISALAREHGINVGQLWRWVSRYRNEHGGQRPVSEMPQANRFVPVALAPAGASSAPQSLTARLPNGIEIELARGDAATIASVLELLWRPPCSDSTRT